MQLSILSNHTAQQSTCAACPMISECLSASMFVLSLHRWASPVGLRWALERASSANLFCAVVATSVGEVFMFVRIC